MKKEQENQRKDQVQCKGFFEVLEWKSIAKGEWKERKNWGVRRQ